MNNFIGRVCCVAVTLLSIGGSGLVVANENTASSLTEAIRNGKLALNFRYRAEWVDDARPEEALASTLRSRVTYTSTIYRAFQLQLEVDDVTALGASKYDDLHGSVIDRGVVADAEGTEANQAWLAYSGLPATTVKYGRQRIDLDNQRFIGGVAWRQNEQTYEALSLANTSLADTEIFYARVNNINRVFGPRAGRSGTAAADVDLDGAMDLLNIRYSAFAAARISAYGYLLDIADAPVLSSKTWGLRVSDGGGKTKRFHYAAEYARQSDYGTNPADYRAHYYSLEAGLNGKRFGGTLGCEVLGAGRGAAVGFATPLATLHKFQGFADQFLTTPVEGIEDRYLGFSANWSDIKLTLTYHDFAAARGGENYGEEVDFSIAWPLNRFLHLLVKYAHYRADRFGTDTKKAWLQITAAF